MKKTYEKPMIVFEDFSLCTNIAASCEEKTDTWSAQTSGCGLEFSGVMIFLNGMGACAIQIEDGKDDRFDKICYHVPHGYNLFNS